MKLYLMYFIIIILTSILFIIIKDKTKALRITGLITLLSSFLLITLSFIIKIIINLNVTSINISTITNYLFTRFATTSITLFLIGIIEILLSKHILVKKLPQE